jgi:hypothetical protein
MIYFSFSVIKIVHTTGHLLLKINLPLFELCDVLPMIFLQFLHLFLTFSQLTLIIGFEFVHSLFELFLTRFCMFPLFQKLFRKGLDADILLQ